jgi:hypothetical protein
LREKDRKHEEESHSMMRTVIEQQKMMEYIKEERDKKASKLEEF